MSAKNVIQFMKAMVSLHYDLNKLAIQKTEFVKKGDVAELQALLKDENKYIVQVRKAEALLIQEAKSFLQKKGAADVEATISNVINYVNEQEKTELTKIKDQLMSEITKLKQQNDLNQELLKQSIQFVDISLDLLQPDIDQYNYDRNEATPQDNKPSRSIFDSKA